MDYNKYKIKGKIFSIFGNYKITNESDQLCFSAKRRLFQTKMPLLNEWGEEVLSIRRKFFSFQYTFYIEKDGKRIFKVFKTIGIKPQIFIESLIEPDAFEVQGNIWATEYAFYREQKEFAYVSQKMWDIRGKYGLAIKQGHNDAVIIALVLIIDQIKKAKRRKRSG